MKRSQNITPLEFVTVVRLLIAGAGRLLAWPINAVTKRVPWSGGESPRLDALKARIHDALQGYLPDWIEHHGGVVFLLQLNRGEDKLNAVVDIVPDRVLDAWSRIGVLVMTVFVTIWGVLLLLGFVVWLWVASGLAIEAAHWAIGFDWLALLQQPPEPETTLLERLIGYAHAIPKVVEVVARALVLAVVLIGVMWLVSIPFLPGFVLHEFGHYAMIRHAGGSVDSYGLVLLGPVLGGAYVDPADDMDDCESAVAYSVYSGGVVNSLVWGSVLVSLGVVLGADTGTVESVLNGGLVGEVRRNPLAAVLVVTGGVDIANSFVNAIPLGAVDGGRFIETREREWWAFDSTGDDP